jgi:hypothetical protein
LSCRFVFLFLLCFIVFVCEVICNELKRIALIFDIKLRCLFSLFFFIAFLFHCVCLLNVSTKQENACIFCVLFPHVHVF